MFVSHNHLPCRDQNEEQIKKWFGRYAKAGVIIAIRSMQGGVEYYELDEIIEVSSKPQKKFFTKHGHAYGSGFSPNGFFFSGISTAAPTGQTHAVIPTPIITELAIQRVSWMNQKRSGVSVGPNYLNDFEGRARRQYQNFFLDWTVEKAKNSAEAFFGQV